MFWTEYVGMFLTNTLPKLVVCGAIGGMVWFVLTSAGVIPRPDWFVRAIG
jgi:hypothetical protein